MSLNNNNNNQLLTILEGDDDDDDVPPPPPNVTLDDETPLPPPPLSLRRGSIPPGPPPIPNVKLPRKISPPPIPPPSNISGNDNASSRGGRRSTSPKVVPGSRIRRATQSFMDDPMMMSFKRNSKTAGSDNSSNDNNDKDNLSNRNVGATGEEMDMQMLRGIFAAFDDNKNGKLNRRELSDALIALGFKPTETLLSKYYTENLNLTGKKVWNISLTAFVNASMKHLDAADDCTNDVMYLFKAFDSKLSGDVSAKMVRHFLHETMVPTRLSSQETDEFLLECMEDPKNLSEIFKYEDLVDKLLFVNNNNK